MNIEKAIIVAAGCSSRLYPLTKVLPKGLLEISGEAVIKRSIRLLKKQGIKSIAVVVGFECDKMKKALKEDDVCFIYNPFFAQTNNLGSLWFAKDFVGNDSFIYAHSDIIYSEDIIKNLISHYVSDSIVLSTDEGDVDEEAMKVLLSPSGQLIESNKEINLNDAAGEWLGIASLPAGHVPILFDTIEEVLKESNLNAYDTEAFTRMSQRGHSVTILGIDNEPWTEIDFLSDLEKAKQLFEHGDK